MELFTGELATYASPGKEESSGYCSQHVFFCFELYYAKPLNTIGCQLSNIILSHIPIHEPTSRRTES